MSNLWQFKNFGQTSKGTKKLHLSWILPVASCLVPWHHTDSLWLIHPALSSLAVHQSINLHHGALGQIRPTETTHSDWETDGGYWAIIVENKIEVLKGLAREQHSMSDKYSAFQPFFHYRTVATLMKMIGKLLDME